MSDSLFKKTPFGGYNREQVMEFIKETDKEWREKEESFIEKI